MFLEHRLERHVRWWFHRRSRILECESLCQGRPAPQEFDQNPAILISLVITQSEEAIVHRAWQGFWPLFIPGRTSGVRVARVWIWLSESVAKCLRLFSQFAALFTRTLNDEGSG